MFQCCRVELQRLRLFSFLLSDPSGDDLSQPCSICSERSGTDRQRSLQFPRDGAEAVEHEVFAHAVDPLAARRQRAAHKVSSFPLTGTEAPHDLQVMGGAEVSTRTSGLTISQRRIGIITRSRETWDGIHGDAGPIPTSLVVLH